MKSTLLSLLLSASAFAATQPPTPPLTPQPNTTVSTRFLQVVGRVPGVADGPVALRFELWTTPPPPTGTVYGPPAPAPTLLYWENQTAQLVGGQFQIFLGTGSPTGVLPSLIANQPSLAVRWALQATPTTIIASQPIAAVAYAMSLAPGAAAWADDTLPTLDLSNTTGPALVASVTGTQASAAEFDVQNAANGKAAVAATTTGTSGRGVLGVSTATSGSGYGVEGRSASIAGAGGLFVNQGGGDLLQGRNAINGPVVFSVDYQGQIFSRGVQIGQPGNQGDPGPQGPKGPQGPPGPQGPAGKVTFCAMGVGTSCLGVCGSGTLVANVRSPCAVTSGSGPCAYAGTDGICCVCEH